MSQRKGQGQSKGKGRPSPSRDVGVSKALSLLLRHAAQKEGLEMNAQGYANVADVLASRKVKSLKVTFPEIINAVESSDKKRFALLHVPTLSDEAATTTAPPAPAASTETPETEPGIGEEPSSVIAPTTTAGQESATQKALSVKDADPTHFLIRATQGHSIKGLDAAALLEKLSLSEESDLPGTVVHGTFHSSWPAILASGGLKCMGRNHVHFATGPTLESVLPDDGKPVQADPGQVISGMRRDAQVLIYVDVRKALQAGCPFWRSENGVILSEGVSTDGGNGVVPVDYFDVVVERKNGLGKIWERGTVVRDLPPELTKKGTPKGRQVEKRESSNT